MRDCESLVIAMVIPFCTFSKRQLYKDFEKCVFTGQKVLQVMDVRFDRSSSLHCLFLFIVHSRAIRLYLLEIVGWLNTSLALKIKTVRRLTNAASKKYKPMQS